MSYDIDIVDPVTEEVLTIDWNHQIRGGTYAIGGSNELSLNVTYNYSGIINRVLPGGIRGLSGKSVGDTIGPLQDAIDSLKDDATDNYWEATEGNAKRALCSLLALAKMRPDGKWSVR